MDLRIAVCMPTTGQMSSSTAWCLAKMVDCFNTARYEEGEKALDVFIMRGSILQDQRQRLVGEAWKVKATHILWLDSDMYFPHDTIQQLLSHGKFIVAANYARKNDTGLMTAYVDNDDYTGPLVTTDDSTGLVQVKTAGMGVMLCDMRVFEQIEFPLFDFTPQPPHFVKVGGEDKYFCQKARDAGFDIWVDQDLSRAVAHIGEFRYTHTYANVARNARIDHVTEKNREERESAA